MTRAAPALAYPRFGPSPRDTRFVDVAAPHRAGPNTILRGCQRGNAVQLSSPDMTTTERFASAGWCELGELAAAPKHTPRGAAARHLELAYDAPCAHGTGALCRPASGLLLAQLDTGAAASDRQSLGE